MKIEFDAPSHIDAYSVFRLLMKEIPCITKMRIHNGDRDQVIYDKIKVK